MSFPSSPVNNQTTTVNGITYVYNSSNNTWTRQIDSVLFNAPFIQANASFGVANSAAIYANGAFAMANAAFESANNVAPQVQPAFSTANSASIYANGAFIQANAAFITANLAFDAANSSQELAQNAYDFANTRYAKTGGEISGDVVITGNLFVTGTQTIQDTRTATSHDNLFYLNAPLTANVTNAVGNGTHVIYTTDTEHFFYTGGTVSISGITPSSFNVSGSSNTEVTGVTANTFTIASSVTDSYSSGGVARLRVGSNPDIGFAAGYNDGTYHHTGLFRDASDGTFKFFYNYTPEPDGLYIDINDSSFRIANVTANIITDVISVRGVDPLSQANLAFDKANGAVQTGFTTFSANAVSITPDNNTDTIYIEAGNNITISACTTTKTITIESTASGGGGGGTITFNVAPPETANSIGDRWIDSNDGIVYTYISDGSSTQWVDLNTPNFSLTTLYGGTTGSLPWQAASNNTQFLSLGTTGQVLTSNGSQPVWQDISIPAGTLVFANSGQLTANSSTGNVALGLATTSVTAGSYNNASITVDAYGRLTAVANGVGGGVTSITAGTGISANAATGAVSITNSGVTSAVAGTGVSVSSSNGAVTFSIGQAVNTSSSVQLGSLGIGTAASGTTGEIRATNNITAYYSDDRLKTRLGNIDNALEKVMTLNGFYYEANDVAQALGYAVKSEVGVSAQEVQKILPQVVVPAPIDDKYLTVHYERMIPLLIEAIKEQQKQIEELKSIINGNN